MRYIIIGEDGFLYQTDDHAIVNELKDDDIVTIVDTLGEGNMEWNGSRFEDVTVYDPGVSG